MKKKLNTILLVDDDDAANFYNKEIILELDCAEKIVTVNDGSEALKFLTSKTNGHYPKPDLILLDINMPLMDGWEFLENYKSLDENQKSKIVIVLLTSSVNPEDKEKAKNCDDVNDYENKPLTIAKFESILKEYF